MGSVLTLLVFLALLGLFTWALVQIPMVAQIRTLIITVAVIFGVLIVLNAFGLLHGSLALPKVR